MSQMPQPSYDMTSQPIAGFIPHIGLVTDGTFPGPIISGTIGSVIPFGQPSVETIAPVTGTFTSPISEAVSLGTATEEQSREYVLDNAQEIAAFYGVPLDEVLRNPDWYAP